jgi:hypothetical protein
MGRRGRCGAYLAVTPAGRCFQVSDNRVGADPCLLLTGSSVVAFSGLLASIMIQPIGFPRLHQRLGAMQAIRIPADHWGKVWRTLIASGPISRVSREHVYLVSDQQIQLLRRKKLPFEIVPPVNGRPAGPNDG